MYGNNIIIILSPHFTSLPYADDGMAPKTLPNDLLFLKQPIRRMLSKFESLSHEVLGSHIYLIITVETSPAELIVITSPGVHIFKLN